MIEGKIRIRLKSYDPEQLDRSSRRIAVTARTTGATVAGPVPLPTRRSLYAVVRGPHVDKRSFEHFEMKRHRRLIEIHSPTEETIDKLSRLDLPAGVEVEIKVM